VMVSAILAARHRTFVLVVTSLFVLFVFPMHNKFLLLLLLQPEMKKNYSEKYLLIILLLLLKNITKA